MVKLTEKQVKGLEVLKQVGAISEETSVCTSYLITKETELVKGKGFDTQKVNGLNATLASLVAKELVFKKVKPYGEKMLTHYYLLETANEYLKEEN